MKPQNISIFILVMHKLKTFSTVHQPELLSQVIPDQEKKKKGDTDWLGYRLRRQLWKK
jgi:hypothetical protein